MAALKESTRLILDTTPWYTDRVPPLASRPGWYEAVFGMVYWDGQCFTWNNKGQSPASGLRGEIQVLGFIPIWRGVSR